MKFPFWKKKEPKPKEKVALGVCVWLSEKYKLPLTAVRAGFAIITILGLGSPVLIYLLLFLAMPKS